MKLILVALFSTLPSLTSSAACPDYSSFSAQRHEPLSTGKYALSYQRPLPECRTFNSSAVESTITRMTSPTVIADPDLARLFENTFPNTLDTAVRWHGHSATDPNEELTFVITGDINAMWLRDSANQLTSYQPLLPSSPSIASLFRGAINLQARYILTSPFCNSFQPPPESGIPPASNSAAATDSVFPSYNPSEVFECKFELDSLAAFLQVSTQYFHSSPSSTVDFFSNFHWAEAVSSLLHTAKSMLSPTYDPVTGAVLPSPYTFTRQTTRSTETLANNGACSPVGNGTGLIRSAFRPSDDATLFQLHVPANMMFAAQLTSAADIASAIGEDAMASEMRALAKAIRDGIEKYGTTHLSSRAPHSETAVETIYAYEVDGFGSAAVMDDANIPSLLSAPLFGYLSVNDAQYQRTRKRILTSHSLKSGGGNPYFMAGPVLSAVGGPHVGPGMAWPMALIVQIMTSEDEDEILGALKQILRSTDGLGLVHESVDAFNASHWTRQWFSWANGLFGQMILDLHARKPEILLCSFQ
ncbi:hypothetical protein B0H63DRAFT_533887 [Podospora didyma]|uniref:Glycoside hydrolase family 125 protein n=1 Tax=Podospora didyma TaxID=330526 RepID=A0AAE0P8E4_9PEZI|nr:hypothetical protein B0H63DRAFT_533887 [Podospora didyma]